VIGEPRTTVEESEYTWFSIQSRSFDLMVCFVNQSAPTTNPPFSLLNPILAPKRQDWPSPRLEMP